MQLALILAAVVMAFVALWALNAFRTQRAAIISILHLVSNLARGQYSRRTDPLVGGSAGELARAANALADTLDTRAAQAQQDSDYLLSLLALLDHTNEIAIATDNVDTVRLANTAASRVLERQPDALVGKHIDTIIHHPDLRAIYKNAFSSNKPVSAQVALQTPGRTLHCQATAATIYRGSHYRGTLLVLRDITEVARTLQMKTDFATNASHELRTPLSSIRAAVETMKEANTGSEEDRETTQRCVDIINNHVLRMQLMVQDLLDLSRAEDSRGLVRFDRVDVQLVCDSLAASSSTQLAEKKLLLRVDLAEDARTLRGDERLLTLVLKNLLDNAIKFTQHGEIRITTFLQDGAAPAGMPAANDGTTASASDVDLPQQFVLEVSDTGIGIPAEDRERVFERFYTVNRSRGGADRGTGLGLSIVKHAVNAMQGSVSLTSELHKGTTVRCVFPLRSPEP